jgi:hypothetical protein
MPTSFKRFRKNEVGVATFYESQPMPLYGPDTRFR